MHFFPHPFTLANKNTLHSFLIIFFEVYDEVADKGQQTKSERWTIKLKIINGQHSTARLCSHGFEEL